MKILIDGAYADGHEFKSTEDVPEYTGTDFEDETDDSIQAHLYEFTGNGHGLGRDIDCYTEITILEAANPQLVGQMFGFGG